MPTLDGLRGVAVLLVLVCHSTMLNDIPGPAGKLGLALARLSWAGVDLFFVLSGFLITGILFDAKGRDNFFRNFYARRTVRIFPLYYAFLVVALLVLPHFTRTEQPLRTSAIVVVAVLVLRFELLSDAANRRITRCSSPGRWRSRSNSTSPGRSSCSCSVARRCCESVWA